LQCDVATFENQMELQGYVNGRMLGVWCGASYGSASIMKLKNMCMVTTD